MRFGCLTVWFGTIAGCGGAVDDDGCHHVYPGTSIQEVLDFINLASQLVNPKANEKSLGNRILTTLEHGDYRDDSKLWEDEREVMDDDA